MTKATSAFWIAGAAIVLVSCEPTKGIEPAVLKPLDADDLVTLLPKPGTVLEYQFTRTESSPQGNKDISTKEVWKWEKAGENLLPLKSSDSGTSSKELYDMEWPACLADIDGKKFAPCMPVVLSNSQPNPHGGFTGPRSDGTQGALSSESSYKGPEKVKIADNDYLCHQMATEQRYKSNGLEYQVSRKAWWSQGLGIVKLSETVTAQGLKRETNWVLSPK